MSIWFISKTEFHQEEDKNSWKKLSIDTNSLDAKPLKIWEHMRYIIEHRLGMHRDLKKGSPVYAYITGMNLEVLRLSKFKWDKHKEINSGDIITDNCYVVLRRHPLPPPLQRYVPLRFNATFQQQQADEQQAELDGRVSFEEDATEDDKLKVMMEAAVIMYVDPPLQPRLQLHTKKHASEYETGEHGAIPPEKYTCKGCGESGVHFRAMCPRNNITTDNGKQALDRVKVAHGIPKSFLKSVEVGESGLCLPDGSYVQRLTSVKLLTKDEKKQEDVVVSEFPPSPPPHDPPLRKVEPMQTPLVHKPSPPLPLNNDLDNMVFSFEPWLAQQDEMEAEQEKIFYHDNPELQRKNRSICQYYLRGLCQKSRMACKFLHIMDDSLMPICQFFIKDGCTNDNCQFKHEKPHPKRKPPCLAYDRGFCRMGPKCLEGHFHKERPLSASALNISTREFSLLLDCLGFNDDSMSETMDCHNNRMRGEQESAKKKEEEDDMAQRERQKKKKDEEDTVRDISRVIRQREHEEEREKHEKRESDRKEHSRKRRREEQYKMGEQERGQQVYRQNRQRRRNYKPRSPADV